LIYCPVHKTSVDSTTVMKWALGPMPVDEVASKVAKESTKGTNPFISP